MSITQKSWESISGVLPAKAAEAVYHAEEQKEFAALLSNKSLVHSPDGCFSEAQIAATDIFLPFAMPHLHIPRPRASSTVAGLEGSP
ncbi:MAG: hypothetical protein EYX74_05125 [Desulfobulbaceae bacterium]|nr:MAG: hypothetical protein EYX74_05125 [Desulfobulbaceae bacterium]